jgi:hypothetical protein
MVETAGEIVALQRLLDSSHASSTGHLRGIINDDHVLDARDLVAVLTGMRVLSVATVTARGEPRISAVDGHFLHATWTFSTDGSAAKARHMRARPAVSVAHVDNEDLAVFSHGRVEESARLAGATDMPPDVAAGGRDGSGRGLLEGSQVACLLGVPGELVHRARPGHAVDGQAGAGLERAYHGVEIARRRADADAEVGEELAQRAGVGRGRRLVCPADQPADGGTDDAEQSPCGHRKPPET